MKNTEVQYPYCSICGYIHLHVSVLVCIHIYRYSVTVYMYIPKQLLVVDCTVITLNDRAEIDIIGKDQCKACLLSDWQRPNSIDCTCSIN